jgi:3-hydroxymyristoyl/3-hydroxydecanoyl-(acyl carrier protein) dehydratase
MPLDPAFVADCPYGPEGLLIDEVLTIDRERKLVRARMPTSDALPLTSAQRADPVRHPRHVSGGLMVHMTGMMGFLHAYYLLDLRHESGWIGYGAKIHSARFRALAPPGEPLVLECAATQTRRGDTSVFARYAFRFTQMQRGVETVVYEGDQSAFFTNVHATRREAARDGASGASTPATAS